jgi:hypothetical protein
MKTVTVKNRYGELIQVELRPDGRIMVNHRGLDFTPDAVFAEFLDVGITVEGEPCVGGWLRLDAETQTLTPADAKVIREAVRGLPGRAQQASHGAAKAKWERYVTDWVAEVQKIEAEAARRKAQAL